MANTRLFEGKQMTMREIADTYFPGESMDKIRSRLYASKATSVAEMATWMARPLKRARPSGGMKAEVQAAATEAVERRFSREARAKADAITGTKGCNYCQRVKPASELSTITGANGRKRRICLSCKDNRRKALSSRP